MKKIIYISLLVLFFNSTIIGQSTGRPQKTVLSVTGEKVTIDTYWSLRGNIGTTPAVNFIGTSDNNDLKFKQDNNFCGILSESNIGFGSYCAISADENKIGIGSNLNSIGNEDVVAVGNSVLFNNRVPENVGLGASVLPQNTTGTGNVASGYNALNRNITGSRNTGIGLNSLSESVENDNTAIGAFAGRAVGKSNNTAFGSLVQLHQGYVDNNTVFGKQNLRVGIAPDSLQRANTIIGGSMFYSSKSNQINIGNGNISRITVNNIGQTGIGTVNPVAKLDIRGSSIKIVDGTQGNGKVLTSDADGVGTWQEPNSRLAIITGITPRSHVSFTAGAGNDYLGGYIDLPAGKWIVNMGMLINDATAGAAGGNVEINTNYAGRFTLSDSDSSILNTTFSYIGSDLVHNVANIGSVAPRHVMFVDGIMRVSVTTATRLYLWNTESGNHGASIGSVNDNDENYLYAIKTN